MRLISSKSRYATRESHDQTIQTTSHLYKMTSVQRISSI
ncbi:unnamed protein product [Acanthoscelides obtectus]|uniref:Uncharacterized protein n=1 Tax=Acanthoscelides obtectus TaxID=200917 RepID=A0A9P0JHQ4_ACAOB|nr:unnamed protein product [Acanthoscelides obtectus]CAK1639895.1 hypothetical protein AOBTE_LOCUS11437 [Acanthoscelides obtectus]